MNKFLPLFLVLTAACDSPPEAGPVRFDPAAVPYPVLSDYAFFAGRPGELRPNERVLPYDLVTPLFTDYAYKARFVWMPDSVRATLDEDGRVVFPDHTVLIKNFYYPADFRRPAGERDIVETRLLVRRGGEWEAFAYVWNKEQTDARLNIVGDLRPVAWTDEQGVARTVEYVVPNKNQCKSCHNANNEIEPIGPRARNLNREFAYPDGASANQLDRWQQAGLLAPGDYAARFAPLAAWDDEAAPLTDRALAYLDVNCGHCHRPEGPAHSSGLYLTADYAAEPGRLGVCKTPVAAGKGSGGRRFSIVPGRPDSSILVYRLESNDPGVMMPELGRAMAHREGIGLLRDWIAEMQGDCNRKTEKPSNRKTE